MILHSSRSISIRHLLIGCVLLIAALLLMHVGYSLPAAVQSGGNLIHHIWADDIPRVQGDLSGRSGQFTAHMNRPASGEIWLENTFQAQVTLSLNGAVVYTGSTSSEIHLTPDLPDSFDVVLHYQLPPTIPPRARLGLMQHGLFGETYVQPAWDYLPPSPLHDLARTGFWILLLLAFIAVVTSLPLTRREAALLVLLWGLALGVQGVTMAEKLQHSDAHFSMENTWDNYVTMGRSWLVGNTGVAGQYTQVANYVYIGILHMVLEPDFTTFYGVNAILGSIVPPLLALAAFALFHLWEIGFLTGFLTALFMPLVHYQQTLQPEAIAHIPLVLLLCAGVLLYRNPRLFWVLASGALIGLCTVLRGSWILLILWVEVIILLSRISWRRKFGYGFAAGVALAVSMAPMIYINFSHGFYMLTPTRSDMQLFRANGLDSIGLASYYGISEQVMLAQKSNFTDALRKDIERDPQRVIELTLRRVGLIWQSEEHSDADQVDYENYSLHTSPTTQLLSLNGMITFRTLLVLALTGSILGLVGGRREIFIPLVGAGAWMLTMILFYALGRFRIGMAIFLLPLAGLAIWEIIMLPRGFSRQYIDAESNDQIASSKPNSKKRSSSLQRRLRYLIGVGLVVCIVNAGVLWAADWLTNNLPFIQLVGEKDFPSDFVPVGGIFGDQIQLLGYAHYETDDAPEGYLTFELFWRAVAPPTEDVFVTLRLVDTSTGEIAVHDDVRLGWNTTPAWPPTKWKVGDTLFEKYLLHLPPGKDPHSYALFVGLFSMAKNDALPLTAATDEALDQHVRVAAVSTLPDNQRSLDALPSLVVWQQAIGLVTSECHISDGLKIDLQWQIQHHIEHDIRLFVHIFKGETLIAQRDERLTPPADALPPNATVTTHIDLPEITDPSVSIQIGFYRSYDGQRLPVTSLADSWTQTDAVATLPCNP